MGVSKAARNAGDREKTTALSQPKLAHKEYLLPREVGKPVHLFKCRNVCEKKVLFTK